MLNYFDMLECLLRVARDYKFNAEQEAILTSLPKRLEFLVNQLDTKFADVFIEPFIKEREKLMKDKVYNPRSVVDDEEGQMYDEDDN
jgi:hypothetical protein